MPRRDSQMAQDESTGDHAAAAVDPQVAPQQRPGADRAIAHAFERQRNERDDDQGVENDRRENGALRRCQPR